jgi:N-methylhydantoinase B
VTFTILADREREGPWGLFGGEAGRRAEYLRVSGGKEIRLPSKVTVELEAGDTISYRTCGGGGYGPADERDPALVLADVRDGKVSIERARRAYGVVIDRERLAVDREATAALRRQRR